MSLYILDTDTLTLYEHGHAAIHTRIRALAPGELAITVLSVEEQITGRFAGLRKARQADELARAYQRLANTVRMLSRFPILSFTEPAIARYGQLLALKLKVGKMDLRIAAVALENNGVLVTRNLRDFRRIPNLVVEDWAV
jgi:tRNA(fMet)-specific endonuclease VapC